MTSYDENNVFAKILRGELPCHKVFEDEKTLVFMDVMPRSRGHCLVIPKNPSRNLLDIAPQDLWAVTDSVQKIAKAAKKALNADGITIQQFNEVAAGQEVFHTHVHILPRYDGVPLGRPGIMSDDQEALAEQARAIAAAL